MISEELKPLAEEANKYRTPEDLATAQGMIAYRSI